MSGSQDLCRVCPSAVGWSELLTAQVRMLLHSALVIACLHLLAARQPELVTVLP